MHRRPRDGLVWEGHGFFLEPQWGREPSTKGIEAVCRRNLLPRDEEGAACSVSFFSSGAFNRLYLIQTDAGQSLMRVSLPVDPGNKTRGEVATLRAIRRETDIPVPEVLAFDDTGETEVGFEWILMSLMPGVPAWKKWRRMSIAQKEKIVEQIVGFQASLFRVGLAQGGGGGFRGIGTLGARVDDDHIREKDEDPPPPPTPGPIVDSHFFAGHHYDLDVPRGPFRSAHDWLDSYLGIAHLEFEADLASAEADGDDEDMERARRKAGGVHRLRDLLPKIFPPLQHPPERTALWHDDLSLQNILVDDDNDGTITGIVDWESVSAMPLWALTRMPKFLDGSPREEEPDRDHYGNESDESPPPSQAEEEEDGLALDSEGKTIIYWEHLMEYEQTRLRRLYSDRMRQLRPSWDAEVADGELKNHFLEAAGRLSLGCDVEGIKKWMERITAGDFCALDDVLKYGGGVG